jgi:hypothetical protein
MNFPEGLYRVKMKLNQFTPLLPLHKVHEVQKFIDSQESGVRSHVLLSRFAYMSEAGIQTKPKTLFFMNL